MNLRSSVFEIKVSSGGVVEVYSELFSTFLIKDYERLILLRFGVETWKQFFIRYKAKFKYVDNIAICRVFLDFDLLHVRILG